MAAGMLAISDDIVVIRIGRGIGVAAIRTPTGRLVRGGTQRAFVYLERGAQHGFGDLAVLMLVFASMQMSESATGLVDVGFILTA